MRPCGGRFAGSTPSYRLAFRQCGRLARGGPTWASSPPAMTSAPPRNEAADGWVPNITAPNSMAHTKPENCQGASCEGDTP